MSGDEWLRLTPAQMTPYILAWAAKQNREQERLEAIDMMVAQNSWATLAPYQGKGKQSRIEDWRVFRRASESTKKPREKTAEEKRQESIARAKVAHAALRRARERKRKGKAK